MYARHKIVKTIIAAKVRLSSSTLPANSFMPILNPYLSSTIYLTHYIIFSRLYKYFDYFSSRLLFIYVIKLFIKGAFGTRVPQKVEGESDDKDENNEERFVSCVLRLPFCLCLSGDSRSSFSSSAYYLLVGRDTVL
jgi:hypothetical protein